MNTYKCIAGFISTRGNNFRTGEKVTRLEYDRLTTLEQSRFKKQDEEDSGGSSFSRSEESFPVNMPYPDFGSSSSDYSNSDTGSTDSGNGDSGSSGYGGGDFGGGGSSGEY